VERDRAGSGRAHAYELIERIAVGGMAEVFRAKAHREHGFEKLLAVKRILPRLAQQPEFERRFIAEAKLAVSLSHANLVQVFDFGRSGGSLYIAMELVDGPDLRALLERCRAEGRAVPVGAALHLAMSLCRGLDCVHRAGVVHRDVSPSNLLVSRGGEVKLADLGVAQPAREQLASDRRAVAGKWPYMSPEQARGDAIDVRSDVFAAGALIHEVLTGERLFDGGEIAEVSAKIAAMPVLPPSVRRPDLPAELDAVILRALERDPARRFAAGGEMYRALLELSYARSLVASELELAELVVALCPAATTAGGAVSVEELLSAEAPLERSRVTVPMDRGAHATSITGATTLLLAGRPGPDGLTVFELAAGEPGRPPARPRGRGRAIWITLAVGAAALAGGWGVHRMLDGGSATSPTSPPVAIQAPLPDAAPPPDASVPPDAAPAPVRTRAPRYGALDLYTIPWSNVYVAGRKVGEAPLTGLRLPVGRHRIRLENPAARLHKEVTVEVPGRYTIRLDRP